MAQAPPTEASHLWCLIRKGPWHLNSRFLFFRKPIYLPIAYSLRSAAYLIVQTSTTWKCFILIFPSFRGKKGEWLTPHCFSSVVQHNLRNWASNGELEAMERWVLSFFDYVQKIQMVVECAYMRVQVWYVSVMVFCLLPQTGSMSISKLLHVILHTNEFKMQMDEGSGLTPEAVKELWRETDLVLQATKHTACVVGLSMAGLWKLNIIYELDRLLDKRYILLVWSPRISQSGLSVEAAPAMLISSRLGSFEMCLTLPRATRRQACNH